jgi:hypothetical protein
MADVSAEQEEVLSTHPEEAVEPLNKTGGENDGAQKKRKRKRRKKGTEEGEEEEAADAAFDNND